MNEQPPMETNRKLDRILNLLQGEDGAPGLIKRVSDVEHTINGTNEAYGLAGKVKIIWQVWLWIGWLVGGIAGSAATVAIGIIFKIKL